jgi:hypothetical protein
MALALAGEVDHAGVVEAVGARAYARGLRYARQNAIARSRWDASRCPLVGKVHGRAGRVQLQARRGSVIAATGGAGLAVGGGERDGCGLGGHVGGGVRPGCCRFRGRATAARRGGGWWRTTAVTVRIRSRSFVGRGEARGAWIVPPEHADGVVVVPGGVGAVVGEPVQVPGVCPRRVVRVVFDAGPLAAGPPRRHPAACPMSPAEPRHRGRPGPAGTQAGCYLNLG